MSKNLQLPDTDLANFSMLAPDMRSKALWGKSLFIPDFSLTPFRQALFDICNVQQGMFEFSPSEWSVVEARLLQLIKKHPESEGLNLGVGKALWEWCQKNRVYSLEREMAAVPLGGGWMAKFWHDFYMVVDGVVVNAFFDPRKGGSRLSREGCRLACSMLAHYQAKGRFSAARSVVFQFPDRGNDQRGVKLVEFAADELMSREEFTRVLAETIDEWRAVMKAREPEVRRRAGDKNQTDFGF